MKLQGLTMTNLTYTGETGNCTAKFSVILNEIPYTTTTIHKKMKLKLLFIVFLVCCTTAFGQTDGKSNDQLFEQKGIKVMSKTELSQQQITQLLSYDFESYRMEEESVIIKVVDGPHLELYSKHKIESGAKDPEKVDDLHQAASDEIPDKHEHVAPADRQIKKLQIRVVDVFGTQSH